MSRVAGVRRIAVLRANSIGDFVFVLPALDALRQAYPAAQITLMAAPWHAEFLRRRPGPVDRVVVVPALPGIREPVAGDPGPTREEFLTQARADRYDIALQLHGGGGNSNPLVASMGARVTAGLRAGDAPPLDRWIRYFYHQHEVFRHLEVVGLVGAHAWDWQPRLQLTNADLAEAERIAGRADRPRVVLHPGAADPRRRWPPERFAAVGDRLAETGADIVLTGTGDESRIVSEVVSHMRCPATDLAGRLTLGGVAGLYAGSRLVVANDTGPLHVATAVGAPTVGIYWAVNVINGAPLERERHRPLLSWTVRCPDCGADAMRSERCPHNPSFVTDVPVGEVVREAVDLLSRGGRDAPRLDE